MKKLIPEFQKPFDDMIAAAHVLPDSDFAKQLFCLYYCLVLCELTKIALQAYFDWKKKQSKPG